MRLSCRIDAIVYIHFVTFILFSSPLCSSETSQLSLLLLYGYFYLFFHHSPLLAFSLQFSSSSAVLGYLSPGVFAVVFLVLATFLFLCLRSFRQSLVFRSHHVSIQFHPVIFCHQLHTPEFQLLLLCLSFSYISVFFTPGYSPYPVVLTCSELNVWKAELYLLQIRCNYASLCTDEHLLPAWTYQCTLIMSAPCLAILQKTNWCRHVTAERCLIFLHASCISIWITRP